VVYKKDRSGNTVLTTLNEEILADIAAATKGKYFHSTGSGLELNRIYTEINKLEKKDLKSREFGRYKEQFVWPLGFALFLLIFEYFLSSRRKKKRTWDGRFE
jgi:Ca-activated chloride channel family protein